jgi:hypothetical protein
LMRRRTCLAVTDSGGVASEDESFGFRRGHSTREGVRGVGLHLHSTATAEHNGRGPRNTGGDTPHV